MRRCQWCQRDVPFEASVCPHPDCLRPLQAEGGTSGAIPPPPPAPGMGGGLPMPVTPATPPLVPPPGAGTAAGIAAPTGPTIGPPPPPPGSMATPPAPMTSLPPSPMTPSSGPGEMSGIAPPPPPGTSQDMSGIASPPPPGTSQDMPGIAPPPPAGTPRNMPAMSPPPPCGTAGVVSPAPVPLAAAAPDATAGDVASPELQVELEGLQRKVRRGKRRSLLLGNGAVVAVVLGLVCFGGYYASSVLSYAEVEDVEIARDPLDPERLILSYVPTDAGTIGFGRNDGNRETQLLAQIAPEAVGKRQEFQWRVRGIQEGDEIRVAVLDGLLLGTITKHVPKWSRSGSSSSSSLPATITAGLGSARLSGQIVNAINNRPVPGARVHIAGTKATVGTDDTGAFEILEAPTGPVQIEISAEGFTSEHLQRELAADRDVALRLALSPGLEEGQLRLVLTWDELPADLDAHLEGPLPGGERFHVHYHQLGDLASNEFVQLDVDDRNGEGPETITVLGVQPGTYRYYVHDYSNCDVPDSRALANSGAEVKVYQGGQPVTFRAGHDMKGNVWEVCTIEVTGDKEAVVNKVDTYRGEELAALGLYDKRTQQNRQEWIANYGGSAVSEKAVTDGLWWLARHQAGDGSWSNRCLGPGPESQCDPDDLCTGTGEAYEMALGGLALLAFQAGGHYYCNDTRYSPVVHRGLEWMVENQRPDGALVGSKSGKGFSGKTGYHRQYMYEHGIAAFALTDACAAAAALGATDTEQYRRYRAAAEKAVDFIEKNQHTDGGWRYTNKLTARSDTSVTGWQVLALKSAKEAGIAVSSKCVDGVRRFFLSRETGEDGRTGYDGRHPNTEATTGVGMLAKQFLLSEPDAPLVGDAAEFLAGYAESKWAADLPQNAQNDYYLWYNCTLGMFQVGGELWDRWNTVVRDKLTGLQRHGGCEDGSWNPDSRWSKTGGRVYSTALAVLTLEVYYRYTRPQDAEPYVPGGGVQDVVIPDEPDETGAPLLQTPGTRDNGEELKIEVRQPDRQ